MATKIKLRSSEELEIARSAQERRAEFHEKNEILAELFREIPHSDFYSDFLFHDMDEEEYRPSIILSNYYPEKDDKEKAKRVAVFIDDLVDYCCRDDVAISPCAYFNNHPKKILMREVYAFVMDIDEVRPAVLQMLLRMLERGEFPMPTAITNSGSGIHFFYILDVALSVGCRDKALKNLRLAEEIYFMLHAKMRELYKGVQRHHLGQDYRVVGSLTKFGDISTAWETGKFWKIENLAKSIGVDVESVYKPLSKASPKMVAYAQNIAKILDIPAPDMTQAGVVYDFIAENKDAAYQARVFKREAAAQRGKKPRGLPGGWYQRTYTQVYQRTPAGNRFNALRALAIVAYKCHISEDRFEEDLERLSIFWQAQDWKDGDRFNPDNVEAILRLYRNGERYKKTSRVHLEELLGWSWKSPYRKDGEGEKKKARTQAKHLEIARAVQNIDYPNGEWRYRGGRPAGKGTAQHQVQQWRLLHPDGRKCDCIRDTGLSKPTVYKWWDSEDVGKL